MATSIAGSGLGQVTGGTSYTPGSGGGQKGAGGDESGGGHTGASDAGGELFVRDAGGPWGCLSVIDAGTGAYGP